MTPSELEALTKWGLQNQEDERRARVEGTNVNPGWTQEELAEFERLRVEDEAMVAALSRSNSNSDSAGNGNGGDGQSNVDGYAAGNTHDYVYASPLTYLAPLCVSLFLLLCLTLYFISKRRSRLLARQHSASRAALAADLECAGTHPRSLSPSVPIPTEAEEPRTLERGWVFRRWLRVPHFVRGYRRRSDPMREVDEDWEVDVDDVGLAPPPYEEKVENDRGEVRRVVSAGSGADSVAGSTVPLRSVAGLGNYGRRASDSLELAAGDAMVGEVESGEEDEGSVRGYGSRNR